MKTTRIYLANLSKYVGKWVDLLGINEEYFIADYEYENIEELNDIISQLEGLAVYEVGHLKAYIEASGDALAEAFSRYEDSIFYEGVESFADLAEQFIDEGCFGDIPDSLRDYIDYEAIGRDLSYDSYTKVADGIIYIG